MQFQNPFLLFWLIHMLFSALKGYDELTTRKKGMGQWRHHDSPCCTSQANSHNFHYFWSIFWDFVTVLMILYYQSLHCNSVRQKRIEFLVFNIKGLYCKSVRICKKKYFIAIVLYKKKIKISPYLQNFKEGLHSNKDTLITQECQKIPLR